MLLCFTIALIFRVVTHGSWWVAPVYELHNSRTRLLTQTVDTIVIMAIELSINRNRDSKLLKIVVLQSGCLIVY
jgi:hypothetical protein